MCLTTEIRKPERLLMKIIKGIKVTAVYSDDSTEDIEGWVVEEPVTLEADKTSTVTIYYCGKSADLEIECETSEPETFKLIFVGNISAGTYLMKIRMVLRLLYIAKMERRRNLHQKILRSKIRGSLSLERLQHFMPGQINMKILRRV